MIRMRSFLRRLAGDRQGVTIVEFAICTPVLVLILMGLFDIGFRIYASSVLQGAVQEAARASTLESGSSNSAALDTMVSTRVHRVIPNAAVTFTRKNYATFSDVGLAEDFTDTPGAEDGVCNNGEAFEDLNGNGTWDLDRGADGLGGARDAVLYGATATFDRVFPLHEFLGLQKQVAITGMTVLRNQPFNEQGSRDPVIGACT